MAHFRIICLASMLSAALWLATGCSNSGSKESGVEHDHEEEECEPGTNCMCSNGSPGTNVCDPKTKLFVMCDCAPPTTAATGGSTGAAGTNGPPPAIAGTGAAGSPIGAAGVPAGGVGAPAAGGGGAVAGAGAAGARAGG